jgi:hypothetical protein
MPAQETPANDLTSPFPTGLLPTSPFPTGLLPTATETTTHVPKGGVQTGGGGTAGSGATWWMALGGAVLLALFGIALVRRRRVTNE